MSTLATSTAVPTQRALARTVVAAPPRPRVSSGRLWAWVRLVAGVTILALLVWQVGTGPFLDGLRVLDVRALAGAFFVGALTTACCAWRWSLIAAGLGVRLPLRPAVAAYYRSQFLNVTLPGGVLGDVHRAVRHGLDIGDVGLGVRAVVLERLSGQAVHAVVALILLSVLPSPVRGYLPGVVIGLGLVALGLFLLGRRLPRSGGPGRSGLGPGGPRAYRWLGAVRAAGRDVRGLFTRRTLPGVLFASSVVVVGHLATFVLAAVTAGSTAPLTVLAPLALLALSAMVLPLNVAGWGPREGVAAWAFAAAGLSATQGVATAVTYGVMAFVASLPGVLVLLARWARPAAGPVMGQGGSRG